MSKLFILRAGYYLIPSSSFLSPKTGVTLKENPPVSLQKQNENCKVQIAKSFSPSFRSCSGIGGIGVYN